MCACINYTDSLITRNTLDRQREVLREILAIEIDGRERGTPRTRREYCLTKYLR